MGRNTIEIEKEELKRKLRELPTQQAVADHFQCSQATISNKSREYGLLPKVYGRTERDDKVEYPALTWEKTKELLLDIQEKNSPTVGYSEVNIDIDTIRKLLLVPIQDTHLGSRYTFSKGLIDLVDLASENSQVFTGFNGDLADNYNTSAYKGGQIEQNLPIQLQKSMVETMVKKLKGKILWFLNGCHDEWSYLNDGFDLAQYLSHKDQQGYYMGHNGIVNLTVGDILYKTFVTHNTFRNSTINDGHGLRWVCREHEDFDVGIKAHEHKPYIDNYILRNKIRYGMCGGSFKGQDRYISKKGIPNIYSITPGILFHPKKREIIMSIDYRTLVKYL